MTIDWLDPVHFEGYDQPLVVNGFPTAALVAGFAHARLSYKPEQEIQAALVPYGWGATLYSPGAGAQMYTAAHLATKTMLMGFRGSQGREFWRDWIATDARAGVLRRWRVKLREMGGTAISPPYPLVDCLPEGVKCGWGFQRPVEELWPVILEAARMQSRGWKILMYGHSMGANLAHGAAARLIHEESFYPDLVVGYEPAKMWNRAGQNWQWALVSRDATPGVTAEWIETAFRSYTFMNSSRRQRDIVTDLPPWAKHGGRLLVAGEEMIYTGQDAVAKYNEGKPPYRHRLPGWRPVSRLVDRLIRRGQGRIGAHLGAEVLEKLKRLYLEGRGA